ncbi:putative membrane protein [Paraburkholderia sp. MM5482-R2]
MGVLIGVPIVVLGFALRFNALLVVTIAGVATWIAGGL